MAGPDVLAFAARAGLRIDLAPTIIAGGGRDAALEVAMLGIWRCDNPTTGIPADADAGFGLQQTRVSRDPNAPIAEGNDDSVIRRVWQLSDYLSAPGIVRRGMGVSRRALIDYFRNRTVLRQPAAHGLAHQAPQASLDDQQLFGLIEELEGKVHVGDRDGLHFELLSIGQAIGASGDLRGLADRIREEERFFRRRSPPTVAHETPKDSTDTVMTLGGFAGARTDPDAHLLENFIRLRKLDTPIYRTFALPRFREILRHGTMALVAPLLWEDPFEDLVAKCFVSLHSAPGQQIALGALRRPTFGQCWSLTEESDAFWRSYSSVRKDPATGRNLDADREGVRVRTTLRRLLRALWTEVAAGAEETCFLGAVRYMPSREALQYVANEIARTREAAFAGGRGHAESLLVKRGPFAYEREVRLLFVDSSVEHQGQKIFRVRVQPNELFSRVTLDPRLSADDRRDRETDLRSLGYEREVATSMLYERLVFELVM